MYEADVLDSGVNEGENMDMFQRFPKVSHLTNTSDSTLHRAENNSVFQRMALQLMWLMSWKVGADEEGKHGCSLTALNVILLANVLDSTTCRAGNNSVSQWMCNTILSLIYQILRHKQLRDPAYLNGPRFDLFS